MKTTVVLSAADRCVSFFLVLQACTWRPLTLQLPSDDFFLFFLEQQDDNPRTKTSYEAAWNKRQKRRRTGKQEWEKNPCLAPRHISHPSTEERAVNLKGVNPAQEMKNYSESDEQERLKKKHFFFQIYVYIFLFFTSRRKMKELTNTESKLQTNRGDQQAQSTPHLPGHRN